jgi:4-amino-4-deoxy-L-arabinose transferase-like glycosyltransferase
MSPAELPRRRARVLLVAFMLTLHFALLVDGARRDGLTFDEPAFLAGAVACWQENDYRLSPDGGALPLRIQGLALRVAGLRVRTDTNEWRISNAYRLGQELLYTSPRKPAEILLIGRLPIALMSVLLGLLVHGLALRLFGPGAALLSLLLYALSPAFLANGHLATADITASLAFLLAAWLAARCLKRLTWSCLALSCLATAAAFCSKMSAILLVPIVLSIVLVRAIAGAPLEVRLGRARVVRGGRVIGIGLALLLVHALAAVAAIWALHGLRFEAFREPDAASVMKDRGWEANMPDDAVGRTVAFARAHRLLPEAWLYGLQYTDFHAQSRRSYAAGQHSMTGWWWFFPFVVAIKTPLATLALTALALVALVASWRRGRRLTRAREDEPEPTAAWARSPPGADLLALLPLLALAGIYGGVAVASNVNVGLRHVLPVLATGLVIAGAAWRLADGAASRRRMIAILAGVAALEGLLSHPHHLAWMNAAAGPPSRRWHQAVDSSLDWGQGLPALRDALPSLRHPGETAWLAYFGTADPPAEGIDAEALASVPYRWNRRIGTPLHGGLYCVGATSLAQLWSQACPGPWHEDHERAWQDVRPLARRMFDADAGERERLLARDGPELWSAIVLRYEELELGRLAATLRHREPDAVLAGGAMLVYRLTDEEVEHALFGQPAELLSGPPAIPVTLEPFHVAE